MTSAAARELNAAFERWARRVRARLALRRVLTGAAVGLLVGAAGTAAAWYLRKGELRPWMGTAAIAGAATGYVMARRRRWSDGEVALYLDGKLGSNEAIATALELEHEDGCSAKSVVVAQAKEALGRATPQAVRAPMWSRAQIAGPIGALAIGVLSFLPLPPPPPVPPPPPGAEIVQLADVAALERIIELEKLDARDEAQQKRLKALAEDAKKLREKLKTGVEKREAQSDLAKLKDGIAAERLSLGDGEQRQGFESALGKLSENPDLKKAAKALGDRDLTELDEEMERLANTLEERDRERAKKTLEEAAEAARKNGAAGVAKALEEQKRLLEERGAKADALKELAKALGENLSDEAKEALEDLQSTGDPKAQKKLAQKLDEALRKLTPEERKRLAEKLEKRLSQALENGDVPQAPSKQQLKELAELLDTPEGQKQLEEQLRRMAEEDGPESEESERQRRLDEAQKGAGELDQQLSGVPMPVPVPGSGNDAKDAGKNGGGQADKGKNDDTQNGPGPGGGKGDHQGETKKVEGDEVRARARAKIANAKPMPGTVLGRAPGRPGETANVQGEGSLGLVAADEVGGVERSDVPEEYREQVGRYFQPK